MNIKAQTLAHITKGRLIGDPNWQASEFSTDTRNLAKNAVFIALRGANFDGHTFIEQAIQAGAQALIVEEEMPCDLPQIIVANTRHALGAIAHYYRSLSQALVIAVTGTNGKTSSKEMMAHIFASVAPTLSTIGNLNNDIGLPLTLLRLKAEHRYAVVEMGANHCGEIAYLTDIAKPDIALITNIAEGHLEGFGDLEGVYRTKTELYEHSEKAMVMNADLPYFEAWRTRFAHRPMLSFSALGNLADVMGYMEDESGKHIRLCYQGAEVHIHWQLQGKHNLANACGACAVALLAGLDLAQIARALEGFALNNSRLTPIAYLNNQIFDDTYNANPASFKAGIDTLNKNSYRIIVAGKMAELGQESQRLHQEVARYARVEQVDEFLTLNALEYALEGDDYVRVFDDVNMLAAYLQSCLQDKNNAQVLIKGSRSAHMEDVLRTLKIKE